MLWDHDTGLVHRAVCLFTPQLLLVPNYCSVTEAHEYEQLAQDCYQIEPRPEIELTTLKSQVERPYRVLPPSQNC